MFLRARSGAVVCPSCGSLVGVGDAHCLRCGRRNPGLFGFGPALRRLGADFGVSSLLIGGCIVLYVLTLAVDPRAIFRGGILGFLGPSQEALLAFGASGYLPVVGLGRWWTLLTAGWLHGGLLHIGLNMFWLRQLTQALAERLGPGRTIIVFVLGSAVGFAFSTAGALAPEPIPKLMGRGLFTIGASAGVLALIGGLLAWAQRSGNRYASSWVWSTVASIAILGLLMQGVVDNWAHLGGLVGGWAVTRVLDPATPERGDHLVVALGLLLATGLAFAVNLLGAFGVI